MIDFLVKIYEVNCESGKDYIFLTTTNKDMKYWKEHPIKYRTSTIRKELRQFFKRYPPKKFNIYFSPNGYSKPERKIEYVRDSKFLMQDIDETPIKSVKPKPTYRWESSPGKWVGMWELDRYIPESVYSEVNKYFAGRIKADSANDMVHVYRVPETINHKYKNKPHVGRVIETKGQKIQRFTQFKKDIKYNKQRVTKQSNKKSKAVNHSDRTERGIYAKYNIPQKVRNYLALDSLDEIDDRSSTIWYIENVLINDVGMEPNEVIYLIKNSVFNKYAGRRDEEKQLHRELKKIIEGKVEKTIISKRKKKGRRFKTTSYSNMRANGDTKIEWLVKGFWGKKANGIVAGMPKSFKSTITTDLAISVASGRPFLGVYPVETTGNVLIIQNENAEGILNDRMHKISGAKGLGGSIKLKDDTLTMEMPKKLPITFVNNQGFNLSSEDDCEEFEYLLQKHKPVLTILDPLYLMFNGDMNSAQDLNPVLNYLNQVRDKYGTSIMLIHHYNKGNAQGTTQRGGQRMAGSVFLYGWIENAWYFEKHRDEDTGFVELNFAREFRGASEYPELELQLIMGGEDEKARYQVEVYENGRYINMDELVETAYQLFKKNATLTLTGRYVRQSLALNTNKERDKILKRLIKRKKIKRVKGGYCLNEV